MYFEDFFGGSMPGASRSGRQEDLDNGKFYKILGLEKNADQRTIKKAWRKLCKTHHPDRGGNPEKFKECEQAYEVLSDSAKRELYDEGGIEAVNRGGTGARDIFDLFGGSRKQRPQGPSKPQVIKKMITIELEDVYKGPTKKITISVLTATEKKVCGRCDGRGIYMETVQRGPMIMQHQRECTHCGGKGIAFIGEKTKKKKLEVFVPQGVKDGDKQILEGEGHDLPDMPNGDIIIIYSVKPHKRYTRIQADLALQKELTLKEALCGYTFFVRHINGNDWIRIHSKPGEIIQPNNVIKIEGVGLPQKNNRSIKGNLYVRFNVILPSNKSLNETVMKKLKKLLDVKYNMPNKELNDNREIKLGSKVRLVGLQKRPDLNGLSGTVIQSTGRSGQFAVHLETGQNVAVREELLEIIDAMDSNVSKDDKPLPNDYIEEVSGVLIDDFNSVQHTASEYGKSHEEDEDESPGVGCKQM